MRPSTHYYVLSLGQNTTALFEAFRDSLIEVENQGFPVVGPIRESAGVEVEQEREFARTIDQHFGVYYGCEPLAVVLVGAEQMQSIFSSVTVHGSAIIGRIDGDHTTTSARDLGQIVWPVVKASMSGMLKGVMHDLDLCSQRDQLASGLHAVATLAKRNVPSTLLVEDGYRRRGSIRESSESAVITLDVDIRDTIDDAVDAVIETVLEAGGDVVFTPPGSLRDQERIVLLQRDGSGA